MENRLLGGNLSDLLNEGFGGFDVSSFRVLKIDLSPFPVSLSDYRSSFD